MHIAISLRQIGNWWDWILPVSLEVGQPFSVYKHVDWASSDWKCLSSAGLRTRRAAAQQRNAQIEFVTFVQALRGWGHAEVPWTRFEWSIQSAIMLRCATRAVSVFDVHIECTAGLRVTKEEPLRNVSRVRRLTYYCPFSTRFFKLVTVIVQMLGISAATGVSRPLLAWEAIKAQRELCPRV